VQTNKLEDFKGYYIRTKKSHVQKLWKSPKEEGGEIPPLVAWLPSFYEQLYDFISQELAWAVQVVDSPQDLVAALLNNSLSSLDPSFPSLIKKSLDLETAKHLVIHFLVLLLPSI